jgi:ribose/xylose/arabinose/galactoside ABC-type transport system permease subunit
MNAPTTIAETALLFLQAFGTLFLMFIVTAGISIGAIAAVTAAIVLRVIRWSGRPKWVSTKKTMAVSFVTVAGLFYAWAYYQLRCEQDVHPMCGVV